VGLRLSGRRQGGFHAPAALLEFGLGGQVGLQRQRGHDVVVGQQPGLGVAQLGLDDRGLPRGLGLPAERA
jgi:hypothetical protein